MADGKHEDGGGICTHCSAPWPCQRARGDYGLLSAEIDPGKTHHYGDGCQPPHADPHVIRCNHGIVLCRETVENVDRLVNEIDALTAEIERMRPVVEAARAYEDEFHRGTSSLPERYNDLARAVSRYKEGETRG